jgi:hypothetical protein
MFKQISAMIKSPLQQFHPYNTTTMSDSQTFDLKQNQLPASKKRLALSSLHVRVSATYIHHETFK